MSSSPQPTDRILPFFDHLEELRSRLIWTLLAVVVCSVGGYFLTDACLRWISRSTGPMVFISPTEAFVVKMKLSLMLGTFMAIPVALYHVWRFIGIALSVSEKRIIFGALPFAYLLFAAGAALGWFVLAPTGLQFLVGFGSAFLRPLLSVDACLEFSLWMTIGLGLLFQLPIVIGALAKWGIVEAATLREYRRHAILIILVVAAIVTPGPDIVSQLLMATPTYILFELSIFLAQSLQPKL